MSEPYLAMDPPRLRSPVKTAWLGVAAAASLCFWLAVEYVWLPRITDFGAEALAAAQTLEAASWILWAEKAKRGLLPTRDADPNRTGMIGPEYTVITTSLGNLPAKRTTTVPDFAGAIVRVIGRLGLPAGTPIVVVLSGSFVGGNTATIAAVEALGLRPVVITSTSASNWGATDPQFTWLDIEAALYDQGAIRTRSMAAVLGGTGGVGREIEPAGIEAIRAAATRTAVPLIEHESLPGLIDRLLAELDRALGEASPGLVINVGGAVIGLGTCRESYEFPPGLTRDAIACTAGTPGLVQRLAAENVPVLHVLNIRRLAREWGLPFDPQPLPPAGALSPEW